MGGKMNSKEKKPYTEPRMETLFIKGSDVIVTSPVSGGDEENWNDNIPSNGWV